MNPLPQLATRSTLWPRHPPWLLARLPRRRHGHVQSWVSADCDDTWLAFTCSRVKRPEDFVIHVDSLDAALVNSAQGPSVADKEE